MMKKDMEILRLILRLRSLLIDIGEGDMTKDIYDADRDNIIDRAKVLTDGTNTITVSQLLSLLQSMGSGIKDDIVDPSSVWSSQKINNEIQTKSPLSHTHTESNITNLNKYTREEVDNLISTHQHPIYLRKSNNLSDLQNRQQALNNLTASALAQTNQVLTREATGNAVWKTLSEVGGGATSVSWEDITDKPLVFTPSTHTHVESQISNLNKYSRSEVDNLLLGKANTIHTHTNYLEKSENLRDLPNKQVALNFLTNVTNGLEGQALIKGPTGDVVWGNIVASTVEWANVTGKPTSFNPNPHGHTEAEIINLDKYTKTEVNSLLSTKAPMVHSHTGYLQSVNNLNDLGNKQTALNNLTNVTSAEVDQVLAKDSSGNVVWKTISTGGSSQVYWADILGKPSTYPPSSHTHTESNITNLNKYTREEVDNFLALKADVNHGHTAYLSKNNNLSDVASRQQALNFLGNSSAGSDGQVLGLSGGNIVWLTISGGGGGAVYWDNILNKPTSFTPSEHTHANYLDKNNNLSDLSNRQTSLNNLANVAIANEGYFLSAVGGNVVWAPPPTVGSVEWESILNKPSTFAPSSHTHVESDITNLDKYTQAQVNSLLGGKADVNHAHLEYLNKSNNLSDLDNRQTALNNLTNAGAAPANSVLTRNSNGDAVWSEFPSGGGGGGSNAEFYLIKLGTGSTLAERCANPNTRIPEGWEVFPASDPRTSPNIPATSNHFVIKHNKGKLVANARCTEAKLVGPTVLQGIIRVDYSSISIQWKNSMDMNQLAFMSLQEVVDPTSEIYLYLAMMSVPT